MCQEHKRPARCNTKVDVARQIALDVQPEPYSPQPSVDPLEELLMELLTLLKDVPEAKKQEILAFSGDVTGRGETSLVVVLREIAAITEVSLEIVSAVFHEAGVLAESEVGLTFGLSSGGGALHLELAVGRRQTDGEAAPRKVIVRKFISFRDIAILLVAMGGTGVGWLVLLAKVLACVVLVIVLFPVAVAIGHGFIKSASWAVHATHLQRKPALAVVTA